MRAGDRAWRRRVRRHDRHYQRMHAREARRRRRAHGRRRARRGAAPSYATLPTAGAAWAASVVGELVRQGVDRFVIAPGARSAPLALACARDPHVRRTLRVVHDERAAAFYALGHARERWKLRLRRHDVGHGRRQLAAGRLRGRPRLRFRLSLRRPTGPRRCAASARTRCSRGSRTSCDRGAKAWSGPAAGRRPRCRAGRPRRPSRLLRRRCGRRTGLGEEK